MELDILPSNNFRFLIGISSKYTKYTTDISTVAPQNFIKFLHQKVGVLRLSNDAFFMVFHGLYFFYYIVAN